MRTWWLLLPILCFLASCATSGGTAENGGTVPRTDSELAGSTAAEEAHAGSGLEIRTIPAGAAVYLNNRYQGLTPLLVTGLERGRYRLRLAREGYHSLESWIRYDRDYLLYEVELEAIIGFLVVHTRPESAHISVDGLKIFPGEPLVLAAGSHELVVRAFGYQDYETALVIEEDRTTDLKVELEEAVFSITPLVASRASFNPAAAGLLGRTSISFQASGWGCGTVTVWDSSRRQVDSLELERFAVRDQRFDWPGRDASGKPLPDGRYLIRLDARGADGEASSQEVVVSIDSSRIISYRSLWCGAAGLLYAPTPDLLPPRVTQVSSLALARIGGGLRAPWNAALRLGLTDALELNAQGGFIIGSEPASDAEEPVRPFFAHTALKALLFESGGGPRLQGALLVKLGYQHALTDTLSNFTGLSAGLPCYLGWGRFLLVAAPEIIVSPWTVAYDQPFDSELAWSSWLYGRTGLLWEAGGWQVGLSAVFRSLPLAGGLAADTLVEGGLEIHWLVPSTQLHLSAALAGEIDGGQDIYVGFGLGLID